MRVGEFSRRGREITTRLEDISPGREDALPDLNIHLELQFVIPACTRLLREG
jgi:hypothetical protein